MRYSKEKVLNQINICAITQFLALSMAATLLPFYIHVQWITGPIINAILIITLFLVGIRGAMVMALIPSMTALSGGLLPAALAPIVPFIMAGNIILILSVDFIYRWFKNKDNGFWLGVAVGALFKFLFLFVSVSVISRLLIKQDLAVKAAEMMSWPQLATALAGGLIAWAFLKKLKRI